jgi:hypothetical protein
LFESLPVLAVQGEDKYTIKAMMGMMFGFMI